MSFVDEQTKSTTACEIGSTSHLRTTCNQPTVVQQFLAQLHIGTSISEIVTFLLDSYALRTSIGRQTYVIVGVLPEELRQVTSVEEQCPEEQVLGRVVAPIL